MINRKGLFAGAAITLLAVLSLAPASLLGPTAAVAKDGDGRFTMQQSDDGMLRLDTQTGTLALCSAQAGEWNCKTISEDKSAQQSEIDRLIAENTALRREIERLATLAGTPNSGGLRSVPDGSAGSGLPSDAEVDKFFGFAEKLLKRFKGLMEELQEQQQPGMPL